MKSESVVHITYQKTYKNSMLIIAKQSMYFYSNGYLVPVKDSHDLFITLSADYKEITVENKNKGETAHIYILFGGSEIPIIK